MTASFTPGPLSGNDDHDDHYGLDAWQCYLDHEPDGPGDAAEFALLSAAIEALAVDTQAATDDAEPLYALGCAHLERYRYPEPPGGPNPQRDDADLEAAYTTFQRISDEYDLDLVAQLEIRFKLAMVAWERCGRQEAGSGEPTSEALDATIGQLRALLRVDDALADREPPWCDECLMPEDRHDALETLGVSIAARWEQAQNVEQVTSAEQDPTVDRPALDEAIDLLTRVALFYAEPEQRAGRAFPVALARLFRQRGGRAPDGAAALADLEQAVRWSDIAVHAIEPDDPRRQDVLLESVAILIIRHQFDDSPEPLATANDRLAEAARLVPPDSPAATTLGQMRALLTMLRAGHGQPEPATTDLEAIASTFRDLGRDLAKTATVGVPADLRALLPSMHGQLAAMRAGYEAAEPGTPRRQQLASLVAATQVMASQLGLAELDAPAVEATLAEALTAPSLDPALEGPLRVVLAAVQAHTMTGFGAAAADNLRRASELTADDPDLAAELRFLETGVLAARYNHSRDLADLDAVLAVDATSPEFDPYPLYRTGLLLQQASARATRAFAHQDPVALDAAIDDLTGHAQTLPEGHRLRGFATANLAVARLWQAGMNGADHIDPAVFDEIAILQRQATADPATPPEVRSGLSVDEILTSMGGIVAGHASALGGHGAAADAPRQRRRDDTGDHNRDHHGDHCGDCPGDHAGDYTGMGVGIDALRERLDGEQADEDRLTPVDRLRGLLMLGMSHLTRGQVIRDRADLDAAVAYLTEVYTKAHTAAGRPEGIFWHESAYALATALRARDDPAKGDRPRSLELGREMIRGNIWRVLLQSGTTPAMAAGSDASDKAIEITGWCVADDDAVAAVTALDSGRALALSASLGSTDFAAKLVEGGHPELADEWRAHQRDGDAVPTGLRQRVLRALGGVGELFEPPSIAQISGALRRAGADALVYLVPGEEGELLPAAVVVPAYGDPALIRLPGHLILPGAIERFAHAASTAARARDAVPVNGAWAARPSESVEARAALRELVSWAWAAAMGDLLAYARRQPWSHPCRLVLVPLGRLGMVPWHAARSLDGRMVLEEAVISYAASARLFVRGIAATPVRVTEGALVVGDPGGDLAHARREAEAINDRIYLGRGYLGRRHDGGQAGPGTPEELLGWLRRSAAEPQGVLHLACHGVVGPVEAGGSYLELAGGRLSATELTAGVYRGERWQIGSVVLAACQTGVPAGRIDEAFSLSTAFLVAGARSVVGSLWSVPDESTTYLMFMFHYYLVLAGLGPAEALREAQLWMLAPDRSAPPQMPVEMAERVSQLDGADLLGWAAFTHLGQW